MPPLPKSWQVGNLRSKEKTYYRCPRCSVPSVPIIVDTPVCPLCGEETEVYIPAEGEKAGEVLVKTRDQLLTPYWQDGKSRVRIFQGDVRAKLKCIPSNSIQCVVTSPPYWGLRDYGTATWEGGDPKCDHKRYISPSRKKPVERYSTGGAWVFDSPEGHQHRSACPKCGAKRIDAQIGSEERPDCLGWATGNKCGECHVCVIVEVFREVKRVLRNDGVLWLNYGDSYTGSGKSGPQHGLSKLADKYAPRSNPRNLNRQENGEIDRPTRAKPELPEGNLTGIPWRVAFALQADGWILRQDNIWSKPNPMRESVRNRCTKAHEYLFHFVKQTDYYFDQEAIRVPAIPAQREIKTGGKKGSQGQAEAKGVKPSGNAVVGSVIQTGDTAIKLSVWTVPSFSYPGAHYATFPPRLITPCILAGTSAHGACVQCGAPWERITKTRQEPLQKTNNVSKLTSNKDSGWDHSKWPRTRRVDETLGWQPTCQCGTGEVKPCVVLDPFFGSGTTGDVCIQLGRHCVGVELSEKYIRENAIPRVEKAIVKLAWTKKAERRQ